MNNRHLTLPLALALALASPSVSAMGLGQLQVKSGLNQPLVAEIPIISATASELDQLNVRLASPEAFSRVGLERPGELTANLQFSVGTNANGKPVIRVTTPGRFSEPLLNFLIEAEWGKGTVTREYTALIDPPYIASARVQPMQAPPVAAPAPVVPPPPAVAPPTVAGAAPEAETFAASEPASPAPTRTVETRPQPTVEMRPQPTVAPPRRTPPPVAVEPAPAPARPTAATPPAPAPVSAPTPTPSPTPPAPEPVAPDAAESGQVGPVAPGQTLWSIASQARPDASVSVNQMMIALLRANPDAFQDDNVNRLKRGAVLRVPNQEEVASLSAAEAASLVSQQAGAWRNQRQPVLQPADGGVAPDVAAAPRPANARPAAARSSARLEVAPPSGTAAARGAQSGASAGAGGSELRAELVQAREEAAARTSEVTELKSRVADLEKQDADRQRLIEMQNSQLKDLQDRLAQAKAAPAAAPAVATPAGADAASPAVAAASAPAEAASPWYLNPFVLGGGLLVLLGGLVLGMRRSKNDGAEVLGRNRLSDDEALRASIARTRTAGERIEPEVAVIPVSASAEALSADPELDAARDVLRSRPNDLEAHLSLLRVHHSRGNAVAYEAAAQSMRGYVQDTTDPRWREAVIMGSSLMPGHKLFSQAGWNSPRFNEPDNGARNPAAPASASDSPAPKAVAPVAPAPIADPTDVRVFDQPDEPVGMDLDDPHELFGDAFGAAPVDIHRSEAQVMAEDEGSATRIELAKAYLDIGDLDGARSMLEEVLAEGGPSARAEAGRLLKEIG